jgi:Tol biopolymer transport system component
MTDAKTIGWLEGLTDNVKGQRLELRGDSFLIGRGATADIQLEDPQVSREHARLTYAAGQLKLEDLGSTHGTYVNGDPIDTTTLKNGDRIRFGGSLFHLHLAEGAPAKDESSQDDVATAMASEDQVATQITSEDEVATVLSGDPESGGAEPAPTVRAGSLEPPAVAPPPPVGTLPAVAQPAAPRAAAPSRKGIPGWLLASLIAIAVLVLAGAGVLLVINLLGGEQETAPVLLAETPAAEQQLARQAQSTPTSAQLESVSTDFAVEEASSEPGLTATIEPAPTTTPTETQMPTTTTEEPPSTAVIGGGSAIAFASERTGNPQIYYLDLASRTITQLTDLPNGACQPAWSPDGTQLAYTSPCGSNREAYIGSTIFIMDVDPGGGPGDARPLMASLGGGDYDPDWSPEGGRIAFTSQRTGRPQIFTVEVDGQGLLNVNDDLAHNWSPSWSGDGSQLALLTGRGGSEEIWLVPSGGGEEMRFSRSDGKDIAKPDWSPDGSTILFEKVVGSIPRIVAAPLSEGGVRVVQVCQQGALSLQPMGEPAWSPDGNWMAFETWPGGGDHKIAMMQVNCTGYEELTEDPALDFDAAWRPVP